MAPVAPRVDVPAAHSEQVLAPAAAILPAEHIVAGIWSPAQDLPAGHSEQVLPVW